MDNTRLQFGKTVVVVVAFFLVLCLLATGFVSPDSLPFVLLVGSLLVFSSSGSKLRTVVIPIPRQHVSSVPNGRSPPRS